MHTILDTTYDSNGQVTGLENTKFILGSLDFSTFIVRKKGADVDSTINIAELPIAVDYFMQWYTENIIEQGDTRKSFPIVYFIRNLANKLLKTSLLENCVHRKLESKMRFQTGQVSAFSPDGTDPFGKLVTRNNWVVNTDFMRSQDKLPLLGDANQELRDLAGPDGLHPYFYNYLVINVIGSSLTYTGRGVYSDDIDDGRYHVDIGSNRGIVKTVKFAKTDIQYQREARFMRQGIDGLQQLANVYKATVEMYGNSLFYPGMEMYINPYGIGGTELGSPGLGPNSASGRSLANTLGVGGYHTITSVKSSITPGKFTTTIQAQWYYSGDGEGNPANSGAGSRVKLKKIEDRSAVVFAEDNACRDIYTGLRTDLYDLANNPEKFNSEIEPNIEERAPSLLGGSTEELSAVSGGDATIIQSANDSKYVLNFIDDEEQTYVITYDTIVSRDDSRTTEYLSDGIKQASLTDYEDDNGPYILLEILVGPNAGKVVRSSAFKAEEIKPGELADGRDDALESQEETVVDMDTGEEESGRRGRGRRRRGRDNNDEGNDGAEGSGNQGAAQNPMSEDTINEEALLDGIPQENVVEIEGPGVSDTFQSNSVFLLNIDETGELESIEIYTEIEWERKQNGDTSAPYYELITKQDIENRSSLVIAAHMELLSKGNDRAERWNGLAQGAMVYASEESTSSATFPELPSNAIVIPQENNLLGDLGFTMANDLNVWYSTPIDEFSYSSEDDGSGRWKDFPYYIYKIDSNYISGRYIPRIPPNSFVAVRRNASNQIRPEVLTEVFTI